MKTKGMNACILNSLTNQGAGFGHPTNKISIYSINQAPYHSELKSKTLIAEDIIKYIAQDYA